MTSKTSAQKGGTSKRGFAAMPKSKVKEIARKGGENSHGGGRGSQGNAGEE